MANADDKLNVVIKIFVIILLFTTLAIGSYYAISSIVNRFNDTNNRNLILESEMKIKELEAEIESYTPWIDDIVSNNNKQLETTLYPYLSEYEYKYWRIMLSYTNVDTVTDFKRSDEYLNMPNEGKASFNKYLQKRISYVGELDAIEAERSTLYKEIEKLKQEIYFLEKKLD